MKMIKFVAATALASVAFLGMTLEPAAARSSYDFSVRLLNRTEVGSFTLFDETPDGVPIIDSEIFSDDVGVFNGVSEGGGSLTSFLGSGLSRNYIVYDLPGFRNLYLELPDTLDERNRAINDLEYILNQGLRNAITFDDVRFGGNNPQSFVTVSITDLTEEKINPPAEPVPEPTTILGSLMAVGMGGALKRGASKKKEVFFVK